MEDRSGSHDFGQFGLGIFFCWVWPWIQGFLDEDFLLTSWIMFFFQNELVHPKESPRKKVRII